jgi:hypothetical protein
LADIGKINAVALANIAKVDAVAAAAIAKINGLVFTAAAPGAFLLDTYTGAAAGYSTRRLATSATNLMRIREDAGDTETDIGYDSNNELDTAAIATHCGTANGYVVTWYDQASSNNATQATETSQPQIYDGTSVITENGKAAVNIGNSGSLIFDSPITTALTMIWVGKMSSFLYNRVVGNSLELQNSSKGYTNALTGTEKFNPTAVSINGTNDTSSPYGSNLINLYHSAFAVGSGVGTTGLLSVGWSVIGNRSWGGNMQEVIVYTASQSTNRTGIETDINTYFSIY